MNFTIQIGSAYKEVGDVVGNFEVGNKKAIEQAETAVNRGLLSVGILCSIYWGLIILGNRGIMPEVAGEVVGYMALIKTLDWLCASARLNGFKAGIARSNDVK